MNQSNAQISPPDLIASLRNYNLLPAIIFLPARRQCDEAAFEAGHRAKNSADDERFRQREQIFLDYLAENPEIAKHKHRNLLIKGGFASHHAGHIPAWKLLIEKMMSAGLLDAIFATSTVAAGVDFPARSVVVSNADRRGNDGWQPIEASELQQMTGRAGRRGKDHVGFVVLVPSRFQNPKRISELLKAPPDALNSRFRATYTSLLNLLDAYKSFHQVREIAEKSFAFRETSHILLGLEKKGEKAKLQVLDKIGRSGLPISLDDARGFERLSSARLHLQERLPESRAEVRQAWLKENAVPGRIVSQGRSGRRYFLVLGVYGEKVSAITEFGEGINFALGRINKVYSERYPLREDKIESAFMEVYEGKNLPLEEPKLKLLRGENEDAAGLISGIIEKFMPEGGEEAKRSSASLLWELSKECGLLEKLERDKDLLRNEIWLPFEHRARVLDHFGYLDFNAQIVTEPGKWLADLRVDKPLLVGEALRRGFFEKLGDKQVAGFMAGLVADSERNYGELYLSDEVLEILNEFDSVSHEISRIEWKNGIEPAPEMNDSAIAAAEHWAGGMDWEDLVKKTKAEEGDLVRLISRTGEALMQVAHLKKSHPETAAKASRVADIVLREPIR